MVWPLMLWVSLVWTFNFYLNLAHHTVIGHCCSQNIRVQMDQFGACALFKTISAHVRPQLAHLRTHGHKLNFEFTITFFIWNVSMENDGCSLPKWTHTHTALFYRTSQKTLHANSQLMFWIMQSNLVIRNFLVTLKLFLNAKCSLSQTINQSTI